MSLVGKNAEERIYNFLTQYFTKQGACGLMGNLRAESGLLANNLQNYHNNKFNLTDAQYTSLVDSDSYTNFVRDSAGYGLAQWTYYTRKQKLLNYAKAKKSSIGDEEMQLNFLIEELKTSYPTVYKTLQTASTVRVASNAVLLNFEKPKDQSVAVQNLRESYGVAYYNTYGKTTTSSTTAVDTNVFKVKIIVPALRIRKGAGTNYDIVKVIRDKGVYTITETSGEWGKLLSGLGWISISKENVKKL